MLLSHLAALLFFATFFIHSVSVSTPVDIFQCSEACSGERLLVNFGVLRSHRYEFEIKHVISSPAEEDLKSSFVISGHAIISGGVNCTYELQLKDVKVTETECRGNTSEKPEIAKILEENRAFFGFDDGIVTGFCPSKSEKPFAWNIKAAILSHLQANLGSSRLPSETIEEDISGKCLTRFDVIEKSEDGLTFVKRKPTAGCGEKYNLLSRYNGILDPTPSTGTKEHMVEGEQECRVSVNFNKPISSSSCQETFVIKDPLRNLWKQLNQIQVTTFLRLVSSSSSGSLEIDGPENYLHSRLNYHESFLALTSKRKGPLDTHKELLKTLPMMKNAQFFSKVIRKMESFSKKDFDILKKFADNEEDMKFLIDAAVHTRTEASLNFLGWCLENSKLQFPVGQMSMVSRPSLNYIQAAKKALTKINSKSYRMVMSNLLKSYCDNNPQCTTNESIIEIIKSLEEPILNGCDYSTPNEFDHILESMRAIGNLGKVSNKSVVYPALAGCLTPRPNRDLYILVSAAEALLRFPQDDEADHILLKVVNDTNQNAEVRIQAFRSYVRHLTKAKFLRLEPLLMANDQLAFYASSYFNEIMKSQDLSKQNEVLMLRQLYKPRKSSNFFNSFYFEKFFDIGGYGGGVESSVIYGPRDSIPRSVDLNYTVNLLGYSFNVLQLKYRSMDTKGIRNYFKRDEMMDKYGSNNNRSRFTVRMFDRDISYLDDIDNSNELAYLASTRNHFIGLNETFTLPTIGGILIQVSNLLPIHHRVTNAKGENDRYGIEMNFDAVRKIKVGLNINEGLLGFHTHDVVEMRVPIMIKARFQPGDFSFGILGTGSNFTAFKQSRNLFSLSSNNALKQIHLDYTNTPQKITLPIFKDIIGLDASVRSSYITSTNLIREFKLEVDRFEGLLINFNKLENNVSSLHYSNSISFDIQRYAPTDSEDPYLTSDLTDKILGVKYKYRKIADEWSTSVNVECLRKSYDLSVNSSEDGELEGVVHLGDWTAKLSGNLHQLGTSDYEMSAQIVHPDYSVSLNQQTTAGQRYVLAAESTSPLLPFVLKTTMDYGTPKAMKYQSELKLPAWKSYIQLLTHLRWDPQDVLGMLSLEVKKDKLSRKWTGEVLAMKNIENIESIAYNYSLFALTEENGNSRTWSLGSSGIMNKMDSVKENCNLKFWIQKYSVNLHAFSYPKSTHVNGGAYEMTVDFKENNKNLLEGKGVLNMNGAAVLNGMLNTSLRYPLVCQGEPGRLNVFLSIEKSVRLLELDVLCGESLKYKFSSVLDTSKRIYSLNLTDQKGLHLRIHTPYTVEIVNGRIQATSKSSVYLDNEHIYTVYENLTFSTTEIIELIQAERVSDGALISRINLNALVGEHIRLKVELPEVRNGFLLDTGLTVDSTNYRAVGAKFILDMDLQKYGFDLAISKGLDALLPIVLNASLHGFELNRSFVVNFDVGNGDKGYKEAGLFVKTHANDEVTVKLSRGIEKETNGGELSLYFSILPGIPKPDFGGFLYKTQLSWVFTPLLLKVEQQGEWNGNKATPPGMPFRYGIHVSKNTKANEVEFQVYAEDTNMGKAFGIEMLEVLYRGESDAKEKVLEIENNLLLNWRRYLGRGVVGSQATLKLQLDKSKADGRAELTWTLPDDNQTEVFAEVNFKVNDQKLTMKSKALRSGEKVHQGKLKSKLEGSSLKIDFDASIFDLYLEFQYEGGLTSSLAVDVEANAKRKNHLLGKFELSASDKKPPKIRIHFAPNGILTSFDAKIKSKTTLPETSPTNFNVEGYFKTEPIFLNADFKFKIKDRRVVKTNTVVQTAADVSHKQESVFEISEDGNSFALDLNIDSPMITNRKLKISTKQGCASNSDYDLQCTDGNKYSMNIKKKGNFENTSVIMERKNLNWTSVDLKTDKNVALNLISNDKEFVFILKRADTTIVRIKILREVVINKHGSVVNYQGWLNNDKNSVETKVGISNVPSFRAIDVALATSGEVGKHDFALKANVGYILDLLTNKEPEEQDRSQLKTYLLHFDDNAFGLEFTCVNKLMITYVKAPINIRFAYDSSKLGVFRGVLQANAPIEIDARALIDFPEEGYLALSSSSDVLSTVTKTDLTSLLGGASRKFLNNGCAGNPNKCISIILGSTSRKSIHSPLVFSILVPIYDVVNSLVIESEFYGIIPQALFVTTKNREVGLGAWINLLEGTITVETAWNRQKGGTLLVKVGNSEVVIENLDNRIEIGRSEKIFYIRNTNMSLERTDTYLQIKTNNPNKFEVSSYLLKDPIICVYDEGRSQKNLKLYRGHESLNTLFLEFSSLEEHFDCKNKQLITLKQNNKSITIDTRKDMCQFKQVITSKINIFGQNGELQIEVEPGKRTFMSLNDDIVFLISNEKQLNGRTGSAVLQYRGGAEKMGAEFRTSNNPMQIFVAAKTAEGEAVLEGNMTSLLDVVGQLWHSYNDSTRVLDAELSTHLDEKSGIYYFNEFWRMGLLYDALVDGMKNIIAAKIPYVIADMEENLAYLFVEGMNQTRDLLDMKRVEETWTAVKRQIQNLIVSIDIPPFQNRDFSNATFAEKLHDKIIELISQIQVYFVKLDTRELYNPELITKILQKIESYSQKSINAVKNFVPRVMVNVEGITRNLYNVVSTNVRSLKSVICDATGQISQTFDQLSQKIPDLQPPHKGLLALKSDFEQFAGLIAEIASNDTNATIYSLVRSLQVRSVVDDMKLHTLKGNLSEISVNATLYLPLWARKLSTPIIADYFGIPLTDSPDAKYLFYFEPLRRVPFHKLRRK
ncbi:unnamed protein product [Hymenolepis diminuta]|uniref:Vitellogenin domain-containing protein n=1 Tax=Hymenolepis diminuta TaxID=6216 RepID=A0A564YGM5_HYMDI|nr:unnamed protein product [Hymenolepis diminuta]